MLWKIIGMVAASLTMFAFIPQIIKVINNKSAKDVSVITLIQLMLGVSLWIAYGVHIQDRIVVIANAVTLSSLIVLLSLYFYYRRIIR